MREMTDLEKKEYDELVANMEQMRLRLEELSNGPTMYGYARVSTYKQAAHGNSLEEQKSQLMAAGAKTVYVDVFTGKKMERPKLQELVKKLKEGDTLVVTKLDRLGRTVSQASELITTLLDTGVTINVLNLGILSNNSVSTLMRNILLCFAQYERDMIVERTQEGRSIARQKPGYREGRPKKYSSAQIDHAIDLLSDHSYTQVVDMTGISRATLAREKRRRVAEGKKS